MNLAINKKLRIIIISILAILIFIIAFLIYSNVTNPGHVEQKNNLYSYNKKSSLDYKVYLNQNNLYNHMSLGEGQLYITEFVNYIDTSFKYEFNGEREAEVKGNYSIIAKVNGFTGEGEKIINIWEKDFPIIYFKSLNTQDGKLKIDENIKLNLEEYNSFVKEIKETTKISCNTTLTVMMNVDIEVLTDKGNIIETISPSLILPLDTSMFEIAKNNILEAPGAIEETIQVLLPVNKNLLLIYGIILIILIIGIILLLFFIKVSPEKDPLEKELNKIFKKYGDRLVALNPASSVKETMALSSDAAMIDAIYVNSFEDLVRLSDELNRPIFYNYSMNFKEINNFFVSCDSEKYVFKFNSYVNTNMQENENINNEKKEQLEMET